MTRKTQNQLQQRIVEALSFPDDPDFDNAVESLREISSDELKIAFEELMDDPDAGLALGIAKAIGKLELTDAAHLLVVLVDEPGKWFSHSERASIRLAAVESIGLVKAERGMNVLLETLESTQDELLAAETIKSLGTIGSPRIVKRLLDAMNEHPHLALSAAGALAQIGGEEAFHGLITGLNHEDEMVQSAFVWALGELGDERAVEPLVRLCGTADDFVRRDVAWSLGRIGGLPARLALGAACQRDPDFSVRQEAAKAIRSGMVLKEKKPG